MGSLLYIPIDKIRLDGETQVRAEMDRAHQDDIAALFGKDGAWPESLPPLEVVQDAGGNRWLYDGFHRLGGAQEAGKDLVPCNVISGTVEDARWLAAGANKAHGLKRTNADKQRAVQAALRLRPGKTDHSIANHVGVHHVTVSEWRKKLEKTGAIPRVDEREGDDGKKYKASSNANTVGGFHQQENGGATGKAGNTRLEENKAGEDGEGPCSDPPAADSSPADNPRLSGEGGSLSPEAGTGHQGGQLAPRPGPVTTAICDELGVECTTPEARAAFQSLDEIEELERLIQQAINRANAIGHAPGGEMYRLKHLQCERGKSAGEDGRFLRCNDLANALKELRHWKPYSSICPHCHAKRKPNHDKCAVCHGLPFVIKADFDRAPAKLQAAVKALAEGKEDAVSQSEVGHKAA